MSVFTLTVTQVKPRFPSKIVYTEKITEERAHVFAQLEVIWCQDGSQLITSVDVDPTAAHSWDVNDTTGSGRCQHIRVNAAALVVSLAHPDARCERSVDRVSN
jgi:hypothetical protein